MYEILQKKLGYEFKNLELLKSALDRRLLSDSAAIASSRIPNYEHLEFLGDRVLNLCITCILSKLHPEWTPSQLSTTYIRYTRNSDDSATHGGPLYRIAKELDLESLLILKPGEIIDEKGKRGKKVFNPRTKEIEKTKEGILSDHVEALFGAIFQDADYNLNAVIHVANTLFKPLGLLFSDHASESDFGASATVSKIDEEISELSSVNQRFIELISAGHHEELMKVRLFVDSETVTTGFWIAITNERNNVIPFLVKNYEIDPETIKAALADTELHPEIKNFLERHLIDKLATRAKFSSFEGSPRVESVKEEMPINLDVDDIAEMIESESPRLFDYLNENEVLFLSLTKTGNHQALLETKLTVRNAVANYGFLSAVKRGKGNIVPYIVKHYCISSEVIENIISTEEVLPEIRNFLVGHLKKLTLLSLTHAASSTAGITTKSASVDVSEADSDEKGTKERATSMSAATATVLKSSFSSKPVDEPKAGAGF